MGKYNTKFDGVKPTEINNMGEQVFKMKDREALVATCLTTFLTDSYYQKERETVNHITELLDKVDPKFAAKLAIYARNEGNLRSVTHLIAATIAKKVSGSDWGKRFYNKIVVRPDDMSEIVSAYAAINEMNLKEIRKIPNSIKKGFKAALERLDAYQIDKYKMERRSVKMIDLVRLFHPKGNHKNAEAYKRLVNGESLADLYTSKILEKEMTKAGQVTKDATKQEKAEAKAEAITSVFDNVAGMPMMNLLRNLRNILIYAPDKVDDACNQLRIKEKVVNSRLLPFRFATAYSEIEKMEYNSCAKEPSSEIAFESEKSTIKVNRGKFIELKNKVLDAIEDAIQISCLNIPKLEGNTAILIDDSGSMRGYYFGGTSRVSAFSQTNNSMIAHLFGSMMAYAQDDVYIGLFGDNLINVPIDRTKKLLDFNEESYDIGAKCGGATECGIYKFFETVIKEQKKVDNVIIFSDCEVGRGDGGRFTSWYGTDYTQRSPHFHELFKQFRKINPMSNVIVVNIKSYDGKSPFKSNENRVINVAGWSTNIFDIIKTNCTGWKEIIDRIEAIEI